MKLNPEQYAQLKRDMVTVFAHYNLSPEAQATARDSAFRRSTAAYRCYRAVAHSLAELRSTTAASPFSRSPETP